MSICRKFVDALNRWAEKEAVSHPLSRPRRGLPTQLVQAMFSVTQHSAITEKPLRFFASNVGAALDDKVKGLLQNMNLWRCKEKGCSFYLSSVKGSPWLPTTAVPSSSRDLIQALIPSP